MLPCLFHLLLAGRSGHGGKVFLCFCIPGFPCGSDVKNPPAVQETQVQSLSQEDPLEKGLATHSSILAWRIPWTEGPGRLQVHGVRIGHN